MFTAWIVTGAVILGQTSVSAYRDAPDAELAGRVRLLVRQLDDDELARRVEAERRLIELGPAALDLLPNVTPSTSAETKDRLGRIRTTLERATADAATKASLVTLRGSMSLSDALAELERQTGNKVVGDENHGGTVQVNFDTTPYWQALDTILDQVGLNVNPYAGHAQALAVTSRPDDVVLRFGRACYRDIFRCEATQAVAVRDLRNSALNTLRVSVEVGWEPRTLPISLSLPADQIAARDEQGEEISIDAAQPEFTVVVQSDIPVTEFILPFQLPDRRAKWISSLKGQLVATIPGRKETFEFSDLGQLQNVQRQRAGVTVTFERLRKNLDVYEIRLRVRFSEAANAFESHLAGGWIDSNEAYLVTPTGERMMRSNYEWTSFASDEVGIAYLFPLEHEPKDYTFVYKTPVAIIRMPVSFELKNIELP